LDQGVKNSIRVAQILEEVLPAAASPQDSVEEEESIDDDSLDEEIDANEHRD
jgi:hypothetical protein